MLMKHKLGILLEYKGKWQTYIKTQSINLQQRLIQPYTLATLRQELLFKTIQFANSTGTHTVSAHVYSYINSTTVQIGIDNIAAKTSINLALGPIILQERDALLLSAASTTDITGIVSIMEVNRGSLTT
jgi:hypothetical protein